MGVWNVIIAVDFDGTLCELDYPNIGKPNVRLIDKLKKCKKNGDILILNTCREGELLYKAVFWLNEQGLHFDCFNRNTNERIKEYGGDCRKISADIYIDDKAVSPLEFVKGE